MFLNIVSHKKVLLYLILSNKNYLHKKYLSARDGVNRGDKVTFSVTNVCGECDQCLYGPQQKCVQLTKYGHVKHTSGNVPMGCYSTHILLGPGTAVVLLPPELDTTLATPVNCALATMVAARRVARHALKLNIETHGQDREAKSVIIYGAGLLGLYGCALFKEDNFTVRESLTKITESLSLEIYEAR